MYSAVRIILLPIVLLPRQGPADEAIPAVEAVVAAIKDRELAITNVSADANIDHWFKFAGGGAPAQSTRWQISLTMEPARRYRFEGQSQAVDPAGAVAGPVVRRIQVFDGQRRIEASGERDFTNGRVGASPAPFILPMLAADLVWTFNNQSVSDYFKEGGGVVVGTTLFDDHTVLVIESIVTHGKDDRYRKGKFYVDSERGFTVVRKAMLLQDAAGQEWRPYAIVELTHLAEVAPGIWLPAKTLSELYELPLGKPVELVSKSVVQLDHWVVNAELPDSLFEWSFPNNVTVDDDITGKVYRSGTITDEAIRTQVESAARLTSRRWTKYIWWGSALIVAVALLGGWLRRRARRTVGPE